MSLILGGGSCSERRTQKARRGVEGSGRDWGSQLAVGLRFGILGEPMFFFFFGGRASPCSIGMPRRQRAVYTEGQNLLNQIPCTQLDTTSLPASVDIG
jgi:hypothetical protein